MKVKVAKTNNVLFRAYNAYRNYTPIHVLTANETIIFNSIVFALVTGLLYWAMFVVPSWLVFLGERAIYYITGQTISISLVFSFIVRQLLFSPKQPALRSNSSNSMPADFYRKK
ncbi:uncharacterized protein CXQ87_004807 [Candidozyma duobushaemuli]|uniref:Uncharacterized protein n=1 Tax=Candidozyma duobushaemuli TaxID=1231522 RepID=A0A2V1AG39_9ASCO|nr:uncharacterized protein CXQ87_004807 [[Candida] duobushaemulonis]PVH16514.1 hypothetical protein CXQ87_004807 [[Candida] duobushaemulonis]